MKKKIIQMSCLASYIYKSYLSFDILFYFFKTLDLGNSQKVYVYFHALNLLKRKTQTKNRKHYAKLNLC